METYIVTSWTDINGKMHSCNVAVSAYNMSEAKANFKKTHSQCRSVNGIHKR